MTTCACASVPCFHCDVYVGADACSVSVTSCRTAADFKGHSSHLNIGVQGSTPVAHHTDTAALYVNATAALYVHATAALCVYAQAEVDSHAVHDT